MKSNHGRLWPLLITKWQKKEEPREPMASIDDRVAEKRGAKGTNGVY
ncbi:hypothetical protein KW850_26990 [Bacillus sp. sid0103]|nr:hypothetical protein [Bacillus sp. sid0103]MBV7508854.1 hypothetical protein [Bacillus sp. sid0103]